MSSLIARLGDVGEALSHALQAGWPSELDDRRMSRSLLSGLLVLASLPTDGSYRGIVETARLTRMNPSTTHRYMSTLIAVGIVERDPQTRRYRPVSDTPTPDRG